jgi:uncharacterized protein (TIGR02117 family)
MRRPKLVPAWLIIARRVGLSLAIAALLFVVATIATARWGNRSLWPPAPGAPTTGWGDEGFYREVPTAESVTMGLAMRALFRPGNPSVLHVVGVNGDPRAMFANSDLVRVNISDAGFARLTDMLDATFARSKGSLMPEELGPGLYGTSLFFRANGAFHLFNVCNHWIANLLDAAGVPTAPVLATLPFGLLLDLEWRSGLARLPPPPAPKP